MFETLPAHNLSVEVTQEWLEAKTLRSDSCRDLKYYFFTRFSHFQPIQGRLLYRLQWNTKIKFARRAFRVDVPQIWNVLPVNVQSSQSVHVFKSRLKTFLFNRASI